MLDTGQYGGGGGQEGDQYSDSYGGQSYEQYDHDNYDYAPQYGDQHYGDPQYADPHYYNLYGDRYDENAGKDIPQCTEGHDY